jgi:predicted nucleic acid-binding Zn ribbon protein
MSYKLHIEEEGRCLECGTAISGRRDKRFCSLRCKNKYNNRTQMIKRQMRARTIAALTGNYAVLEALLNAGKTGAGLDELSELGFDPAYVTCHRRSTFRHDEYACFDIWYYRTDSRIFNVRRKPLGEP